MKNFTITYIVVFFILSITETIGAQVVISTPSLGFSQACASPSFNTYNITFSFSPEGNLSSTNQFIIELSDATGSFSSATEIRATERWLCGVASTTASILGSASIAS